MPQWLARKGVSEKDDLMWLLLLTEEKALQRETDGGWQLAVWLAR